MKKIFIIISVFITVLTQVHAASLSLVQTKDVYTGLVSFDVVLDTEGETVNAFSGAISIPTNFFEIESISTTDAVPSLWLTAPRAVSESDFLSSLVSRTKIEFEGALPGGFDGVRSPYYEGRRPGTLFHFTLRPQAKGAPIIMFSNVKILLNDGHATPALVTTNTATIVIPDLKTIPKAPVTSTPYSTENMRRAVETTLDAYIVREEAIALGKWAVIIHDDASRHTLLKYRIAESNTSITKDVPFYEWRDAVSPFVLAYQERNRFVHVQALYGDATYSTIILPPVENTSDEIALWRILISIGIGMFVAYALHKLNAIRSFVGHR